MPGDRLRSFSLPRSSIRSPEGKRQRGLLAKYWRTNRPQGVFLSSSWVDPGSILGPSWAHPGLVLSCKTPRKQGENREFESQEKTSARTAISAPRETMPIHTPGCIRCPFWQNNTSGYFQSSIR
jgi:hypothetical protein